MYNEFEFLLKLEQPWVFRAEISQVSTLIQWLKTQTGIRAVLLDGNQMSTAQGFYHEMGIKLGFPDYSGKNLNALSECLTDNDIISGDRFVLIIRDGIRLLNQTDPEMLEGVLNTFEAAGFEWSIPVNDEEEWDRPAKPFHIVIEVDGTEPTALRTLPKMN